MSDSKAAPDFTATGIIASDAKLQAGKEQYLSLVAKYSVVPSEATQEKVIAALKEKKFDVRVAKTKAEALTIATGLLGASGSTFSAGGCQSFDDIGLTDWMKTQTAHTNYKGLAVAGWGTPEYAKNMALGMIADYHFGTASAVAETGELIWASATATRVSLSAKHPVLIVGANKIVPTEADGLRRLYEYCKPLVGALTRAKFGAPDTFLYETVILGGQSPFNPGAVIIIFVKESIGY